MRTKALLAAALAIGVVAAACQPTKPPPPPPNIDVDVAVLGDSVAAGIGCQLGHAGAAGGGPPPFCPGRPGITAANGWDGACTISGGVLAQYNQVANGTPACHNYLSIWPQALAAVHAEVVILLTGGFEIVDRWSGSPAGIPDRQWAGTGPQQAAAAAAYRAALQNVVNMVEGVGAQLILVNAAYVNPPFALNPPPSTPIWWEAYPQNAPTIGTTIPNWDTPPPTTYQSNWVAPFFGAPHKSSENKVDLFNDVLDDFVNDINNPNVHLFDMWDLFSPDDPDTSDREWSPVICESQPDLDPAVCPETPLRVRDPDGGHFTPAGYAFATDAMLPLINALLL